MSVTKEVDLPSRSDLLMNAFHPGIELDDPALFAGRSQQVLELARSLHAEGSCPIIYGSRGLGKSSLALQAQRIAMGDQELLANQGISRWAFGEEDSYLAFYVACSDGTPNTEAVLQRLINSLSNVSLENTDSAASELVDRTTRKRISFKLFEVESIRKYQPPQPAPRLAKLTTEEQLLELVTKLQEAFDQRVLIIIDELDRVRDTAGLASFIKMASSRDLKFLLVGIGQNISNLLSDHQSLERIAVPVEVPGMNRQELEQIVDRAMAKLVDQEVDFAFDPAATRQLSRIAAGFPWFVHLLGQSALIAADGQGQDVVQRTHVAAAVKALINNRLAQQFADLYQTAVRDSRHRELVLRATASWSGRDIPTADIYRAVRRLGVRNPSVYIRHLSSDTYGRILLRPPYQARGVLRFANEMFKVYIRIRPSLYADADTEVHEAWRLEFGHRAPGAP